MLSTILLAEDTRLSMLAAVPLFWTESNCDRNFSYEDVHVDGTERIAEAVAKYDIDRFIHVSSYNVDPASSSEFFRTKVY